MRILTRVAGVVLLLMGLLWIGQGSGVVHWPESSFMIDQRPWIWRGVALAVAGAAIIGLSMRRGR